MKILITGSTGQLGQTFKCNLPEGIELINTTKNNFNLLDDVQCFNKILEISPQWILNFAAYTNVDLAEKEKEIAFQANGKALDSISKAALITGSKILHISTDFVFDGKQNFPYQPYQNKNPINIYGISKSQGEDYLIKNLKKKNQAIILRTSWLMGPFGNNFALKMLKLLKTKKQLGVVSDQVGCPTSCFSLKKAIWKIITKKNIFNEYKSQMPIFHFSDCGVASWYDVAIKLQEFFIDLNLINRPIDIFPIKTKEFNTPAKRPKYSILDCDETYGTFNLDKIHWTKALKESLSEINKIN